MASRPTASRPSKKVVAKTTKTNVPGIVGHFSLVHLMTYVHAVGKPTPWPPDTQRVRLRAALQVHTHKCT
eukprot:14837394-Heterocapsa_arctica.AAC.1